MIKTVIFFIVLIMLSCTKESINPEMDSDVKDSNDSEQEVLVESDEIPDITEVDDETFEVDDEIFEVDDETFEVDDETFEVDDEAFEVDDEAFEVDDETFDVDDDADIVEVPLDGFGLISGACGVLDDELVSSDSFIFLNKIDFKNDPYDEADYLYLSTGGKKIYDDGNLGGSSIYSEIFAYEVLYRCELADLLKTEGEIGYDISGKVTDILINIDGIKIGVSVTRAVKFPFELEYTVVDAETLLSKKLNDIIQSSQNVSNEDKWEKQILHVIAYSDNHAQSIETAYESLDESVKTDTIVFVTVSDGDDSFLY